MTLQKIIGDINLENWENKSVADIDKANWNFQEKS